ncbi:MAG: BTAD domain-containing putative transcriptional regulator [Caldilineaceae bacterium]
MVSIHLLGKFAVTVADHVISGLEASKAQEIFAYLLVHRQRPHTREVLIDQLWTDYTKDQAQKGLRQALWQLQSALGAPSSGLAETLLLVDTVWVQLNPAGVFWLDVAELEASYDKVQGTPGHALTAEDAQRLTATVQLYRGDLLEGCYHDWCLAERERLQQMHLALLDKLMDYDESQGNYETALAYGERILRYDRAREQTHRKLMQLHCLAGDRTGALRQYEACVAALATELTVKPAKRTEALYQAIKADRLTEQPLPTVVPPLPATAPPSLPALLTHLQQIYVALADLQNNVANDIELIEQLLHTSQ